MILFMDYYSRRSRVHHRSSKVFLASSLAKLTFFGLIGAILLTFALFIWYSRDLPTPQKLSSANLPQSTKILDRNGVVLYDIYSGGQNRTYVELGDIPKVVQQATIAVEDKDFYRNEGYSLTGYLRALRDVLLFRRLSGGSTLTQQLVKNTLLTAERTVPRKIKEFMLAVQVDRKYSKDQILELYLNVAPYGGTAVGIEAAAEKYFGKKAGDLTLIEAAVLAGFPQRPSHYSPYGQNQKAYIERTKQVLRRMREDGSITRKQELEAVKSLDTLEFLEKSETIRSPHFSFFVKDLLLKQFGEALVESGGLQVTTTLDYKLQEKAEKIVKEEVEQARSLGVGNGASVVVNPKNGEILAMVGSRDFFATEAAGLKKEKVSFEGQFNVAVQGLRQPGSSIKPVTYATALEKGYSAATVIMDTKTVFPNQGEKDYIPENYDRKFHGPLQLRLAIGSSINLAAVKLLAMVGIRSMLTTANNLGLTTLAPSAENIKRFGLSVTLGGGEVRLIDMASSFCAFANTGYRVEPIAILKVTDPKGNVLFEQRDSGKRRVLREEVAFIISDILSDNTARLITFGENSYLNVSGKTIAVKTGTTDDRRDNWTIGWTPSVLVGAWVGNNDNSPMREVASGVTGAAPIWRRIILEALKGKPNEDFEKPGNVTYLTIDAYGGGLPVDGRQTRAEYFIKGTEPQGKGSIYKDVKVSKADTNKLASKSEVEKNEYEVRKFVVFSEKDPISTDGKNRWQEGIDAWINENYKDDPLYHPPTETSTRVVQDTPTPAPSPTVTPTPSPTPKP